MDTIAIAIISSIALIIVVKLLLWILEHLSLRWKMKSIPGPKTLPFIGLSREIRKIPLEDLFQWFMDLCSQYENGMIVTWIGTEPTVQIRKAHQVEVILRSRTLIRKSGFYQYIAYWLGNGLLTSTGDKWHRDRRLITPAFHFGILHDFAGVISDKVEILNNHIEEQVAKNSNKPINIFPSLIKFTLDTVCQTVMGIDMDIQRQEENEYVKSIHRFAELTIYRYTRFLLRSDFIFDRTEKGKEYRQCIDKMHKFTMEVIAEKSKTRDVNKTSSKEQIQNNDDVKGRRKTKAFLDLLMELSEADENPLSAEEIREQVDTFMFGGHDTTGIAISWALFCLGNSPDVQKKLHEEIDDVIGYSDTPATQEQLSQLKYLDRVIKETLRLFPSAPSVSRTLDHDVVIDGYSVPRGVQVSIQILLLHRDPEVWENPNEFDPDRFLPDNSHGRHPYAYIPFSAGPRNCIGQKFALLVLKIALSAILKKWTVSSEQKISEVKLIGRIVLPPPDGILNLYFTPRQPKKM